MFQKNLSNHTEQHQQSTYHDILWEIPQQVKCKNVQIQNCPRIILQKMMKDNEHLFRPFPGQIPTLKKQDYLLTRVNCKCAACEHSEQIDSPQIFIDEEIFQLHRLASNVDRKKSDLQMFLDQFCKNGSIMPQLPFLDTLVLNNGNVKYLVEYDKHKVQVVESVPSIKNFILQKKMKNDLQYQKKKYMRRQFGFSFTQLDHQSEKLIKEFQNNIKYISSNLNRIVIVKVKNRQTEQILSMTEFTNMFEKAKVKAYDLSQIEYFQIFPIMSGEEECSYQRQIKFFREKEANKQLFKLAEHYFSSWYLKNETQDRVEHQLIESIREDEDSLLLYYTFKILIHFQHVTRMRIDSAIVHFITNDQGTTFFFKSISEVKVRRLLPIQEAKNKLPKKKEILGEDYIQLRGEMDRVFQGYQNQFSRLENQRYEVQSKLEADKQFSNLVYRTITKMQDKNFHEVLESPSKRYKKKYLKLK